MKTPAGRYIPPADEYRLNLWMKNSSTLPRFSRGSNHFIDFHPLLNVPDLVPSTSSISPNTIFYIHPQEAFYSDGVASYQPLDPYHSLLHHCHAPLASRYPPLPTLSTLLLHLLSFTSLNPFHSCTNSLTLLDPSIRLWILPFTRRLLLPCTFSIHQGEWLEFPS